MGEEIIWSEDVCSRLNRFQRHGFRHPFTCGGNRGDEAHRAYQAESGDPEYGLLVATPEGWRCPVCDYRQDWYHSFMLKEPVDPLAALRAQPTHEGGEP